MRTHFATGAPAAAACGRGRRISDNVNRVDCQVCQRYDVFIVAKAAAVLAAEQAFEAQTPRKVIDMWQTAKPYGSVFYVCRVCGGDLWRERPRSLFSFHFVCEGCGNSIHPMTETGMST